MALLSNEQARLSASVPSRPLTLAFFSSSPGGTFSVTKWLMWRGIANAAQEYGVNLVYVAGEEFENAPQAVLYELIGQHNVDGIILWNTFVSQNSTNEKIQSFVDWFQPLPVVSVEMALQGSLNLLVDNTQGLRDLLAHLIDGHGYTRIAFVGKACNHASQVRQAAFETIMRAYGLFDARLVGSLEDLHARGVRFGQDCQAIMAYTDDMAVQVVEAMYQRGLRVPEDLVVTGFNDGLEARGSRPPLTTVRLPFQSLGRRAVELLVGRIRGEAAPQADAYLLPYLILRRSCGCLEPMAEQAAAGPVPRGESSLREVLAGLRGSLPARMIYRMGTSVDSQANAWAENLVDIFTAELEKQLADPRRELPSRRFLADMNDLMHEAVNEGSNVSRWHEALTLLRQSLLPYLKGDILAFAEDLFQQARVLVGQVAVRAEIYRSWETARRADILRETEAELLIAFEFDELLEILTQSLSKLKVRDFYLVLYENAFDTDGRGRLMLAYQQGQRVPLDPDATLFQVRNLLPEGWLKPDAPHSLVLEALHLREEQMGYVVFDSPPPGDSAECDIYQALRIQLSSALKGVRLRQKLQDARQQAEEANLLKSRFLSMVSHELRTPLNLIVGLSEMAMRQQARDKDSDLVTGYEVMRKFMEQIYVSGQHLDRLIRDVLDLASSQVGQMSLHCKPLDLRPVLEDVATMGGQLAKQKSLRFRVEVPEDLPCVSGDKTRLRQILLNLLSNAVKFTAHGEVALLVTVEDEDIQISVQDTGLGIAREDQDKIFDEFHQTDRSVSRGYGGIGLGLAITRRLVELHGGRIWATSTGTEGKGSTFSFTLPILSAEGAHEVEEPLPLIANLRAGKVLIISAGDEGSHDLAQHLAERAFEVEELAADQTADLVQNVIDQPPGAVVLNLAPASELGWEIVKQIKDNPLTQDIPVMFYSLIEESQTGAVLELDYLTKPVGTDDLVKALRRYGLVGGEKNHPTLLIIDDEPGTLDMHVRMVHSQLPNCQVVTARSGAQGLEMMRQHLPNLVLLDLMMPELDGFGVLKQMQLEEMLRNIPVIVLSGQVLTHREMERLNQGVAAVLAKGLFRSDEILQRIESVLSRSRRVGSDSQRLVHQAMAYIHEHYKESISRSDVAKALNINEQYLSRCLTKMWELARWFISAATASSAPNAC